MKEQKYNIDEPAMIGVSENIAAICNTPSRNSHQISVLVSDDLLDTEDALRRALVSLERANMAREAHYAWNSITTCNRRMAEYLTGAFPSNTGGSLLVKALDRAFSAYVVAEPGDRLAPLRAYFDNVLSVMEEVFAFRVFSKDPRGRSRRWVPFSMSIKEFIRVTDAVELLWFNEEIKVELNRDLKRGMIAACILSYEDLVLFDQRKV